MQLDGVERRTNSGRSPLDLCGEENHRDAQPPPRDHFRQPHDVSHGMPDNREPFGDVKLRIETSKKRLAHRPRPRPNALPGPVSTYRFVGRYGAHNLRNKLPEAPDLIGPDTKLVKIKHTTNPHIDPSYGLLPLVRPPE